MIVYLVIISTLSQLVSNCNNFGDFCDKGEDGFVELSDTTSLDLILNSRLRARRNVAPMYAKKEAGRRVTETLDSLFEESSYDRRFRPSFGGEPTEIKVNLFIRSMGPVDEGLQKFTFDCYFRQYWTDLRLSFNNTNTNLEELPMNWKFLSKIWRPDTYFLNGKDSYLHKVVVPNRFIRIAPTGKISYSQRLTVTARCQVRHQPRSDLLRVVIKHFFF